MSDQSSELENLEELKFSRHSGFFDKNGVVQLLIGIVFTLFLFVFLHFREDRVEVLELNTVAPSYIVAQVDIDFFDEEATIILKQEAVRDIGKIYSLSENEIRQRRLEFENYLMYARDWRGSSAEKNEGKAAELSEAFKGVEFFDKALSNTRFTDPRTLQKLQDNGFNSQLYLVYTPSEVGKPVILPSQIWRSVAESAFENEKISPESAKIITAYFEEREWIFDEDIPSQRNLRKKIQSQVPDKYTHISAGSRIIDQGERVNARHIAILQAMKKAIGDHRNLWHPLTLLGSFLLSLILAFICYEYFRINQAMVLHSNRKLLLLVTVVLLTMGLSKMTEYLLLTSKNNWIDGVRYPLFVPFAAILLCSLMNSSIATFACGFLTVVLTVTLAFERQGFMLLNLAAAIVAVISTKSLRKRKEIFIVCLKAWAAAVLVIFSFHFYQNTFWSGTLLTDIIVTSICMLLTAILVVGLLPLLESFFKIMTDVTMMEYMDPNNDLLRRLSIEAPGTYQHSVVVGNLAEAAALAIGANGLFCRVSAMYHDIGKMVTPQYFTENQQGGVNIHQLLTPRESASVIIAHVPEGVAMARKADLPEQFIDIIKEHHGTTLVYFFYRKEQELQKGDKQLIVESDFRYSGPKPRSKESAIIMIADSMEAASRSLEIINEETLTELVERLVGEKARDGQFDNCLITYEELAIVKQTLVKTLVAYSHARIKYPKREPPPQEAANAQVAPSEIA